MTPSRPARLASALVLGLGLVAVPRASVAGLPATPVEQWRWHGPTQDAAYPWPATTPLLAQLTDDDGDARIDDCDVPEIVFLHFGNTPFDRAALTALDGLTGGERFTVTAPGFGLNRDGTPIAVGDVDADGIAEILVTDGPSLIVLEHDGSHAFNLAWPTPRGYPALSIGLADLDQDGATEIFSAATVVSTGGTPSWTGAAPTSDVLLTSFSHAADVDPASPGMELLFGNSLYAADGSVLWTSPAGSTGGTAIGDLDGDGDPEIVLVSRSPRAVHVLGVDGAVLGPAMPIPGGNQPSAPFVADIDADGRAEIVVQVNTAVQAFDWDGTALTLKWTAPGGDSSCCGGVSGFDFDGDGAVEVVYRDESDWYVVEGIDGSVLHREPSSSATGTETPIVADIDADGIAEIVVSGFLSFGVNDNSVIAYEVPGAVVPRAAWNQQGYHATNVEGSATVPRVEPPAWTAHLSWGAQVAGEPGCCPLTATPPVGDATICAGEEAVLDAGGLGLPQCAGTVTYTWRDESGAVVGTSAVLRDSPASTTTYVVTVECTTDPDCAHDQQVEVVVQERPTLGAPTVVDLSPCNLGMRIEWPDAAFTSPAGGVYHLYRSADAANPTCADALAQPPLVPGTTATFHVDATTSPGGRYVYVVVAEDAVAPTACAPTGPTFGGATVVACSNVPVPDLGSADGPQGVFTVLFGRHASPPSSRDEVTFRWPAARALLPGERFVLRKAWASASSPFSTVSSGDDTFRAHVETDVASRLQFFDLRVMDACGSLSAVEYPPGR